MKMSDELVGDGFLLVYDRQKNTATAYIDTKRYGSVDAGRERITEYLEKVGISTEGVEFKDISEYKR